MKMMGGAAERVHHDHAVICFFGFENDVADWLPWVVLVHSTSRSLPAGSRRMAWHGKQAQVIGEEHGWHSAT
jgi:hypothetical protein